MAVSVTSSPRRSAGGPSPGASPDELANPPADSCLPERLTQVTNSSGRSPAAATRPSAAGLASTNSPSGMIRPVASATGMKRSGGTRPRVGECQRRSASTPTIASALEVDLRLVVDCELAALEAEPELVLEPEQLAELAGHLVVEELVAAAPGLLGGVHRDVRVADQIVARAAAAGVSDDADARAERELVVCDRDRIGRGARAGAPRPIATCALGASSRSANSSPPSRASVSPARMASPNRRGHLLEEPVAGVMAEPVVDLLEPVQVDEQHAHRQAGALRPREGLVEAIAEQRAVGEIREPVVERLPGQLLLEPDALGDVARVQHDAAERAGPRAGRSRGPRGGATRRSGWSARKIISLAARRPRRSRAGCRARPGRRSWMKPSPSSSCSRSAEHRLHRLAGVAAAVFPEDEHEVGGGPDEAAEVRRLPARRGDEGPALGQRDEEPEDAQPDLERDQVADVVVGRVAIDRAASSETFEVIAVRMRSRSSASGVPDARRRSTSRRSRAGPRAWPGRCAVRSLTSRRSCFSWPRTSAPEAPAIVSSSSSPLTAGALPPSSRALALSRAGRRCTRDRPCALHARAGRR